MEERCELCEKKAMVHCDSDHAKLCWGCDARVHSANFLVEKHTRVLLCRICNSHTQWKACGPKLIPSASFCHRCMANGGTRLQHHVVDDDDDGRYSSDDSESDDDDDDDNNIEEEDDKGNQVVPFYSPSSIDSAASALKRQRDNSLSIHSNSPTSTSSEMLSAVAALPSGEDSSLVSSFRPLKKRRINQ